MVDDASRFRRGAWLLGVLTVTLAVHLGVFDNAFHYDDIHSVVDNPHLARLDEAVAFFTDPATFSARPERAMYRPLVVLSYAVQRRLGATTAADYLVANLAAHLACAALVLALGRVLGLPAGAAALAAALFALHPANAEVVNYVSSRSESFAAAGVLAAAAAYLRWRQGGGPAWGGAAVVAAATGLLAKATAVVLPVWLWIHESLHPAGRRWWRPGPVALLTAAYVAVVADLAGRALGAPVRPLSEQLWTQLKAGPYYLYLLALPGRLTVEHPFAESPTPWAPAVLAATALGISLAAVLQRARPQARALAAWAVLALAPASLVPLNVLVNEHRLYLASACLALLAAAGAARLSAAGRRRVFAAALPALLLLALLARQRSQVWDSEMALWSEAVGRAPAAYRAHLHLGGALQAAGDEAGALARFAEAARLAPDVPEVHYNLGNARRALGDGPGARGAWERCLELSPHFVEARLNLAALLQDLGDWEGARHQLREVVAGQPHAAAEAWRRLGVLERRAGDPQAARRAYDRALDLDPTSAQTHFNLGNLAFYEEADLAAAAQHYQAALALDPEDAEVAYSLADTWLRLGDAPAAERVCRQALGRASALRRAPALSKLVLPLAQALEAQGQTAAAIEHYRAFLRAGVAAGELAGQVRRHVDRLEFGQGERQGE